MKNNVIRIMKNKEDETFKMSEGGNYEVSVRQDIGPAGASFNRGIYHLLIANTEDELLDKVRELGFEIGDKTFEELSQEAWEGKGSEEFNIVSVYDLCDEDFERAEKTEDGEQRYINCASTPVGSDLQENVFGEDCGMQKHTMAMLRASLEGGVPYFKNMNLSVITDAVSRPQEWITRELAEEVADYRAMAAQETTAPAVSAAQ